MQCRGPVRRSYANISCIEEKSGSAGCWVSFKSDRQQCGDNGVACHPQKVPEHSVVPREGLLWHPRVTSGIPHQEPPQGEASWSPGGTVWSRSHFCANPGSTSLTISKLLFPRLCNHDNAGAYLIGWEGGIKKNTCTCLASDWLQVSKLVNLLLLLLPSPWCQDN